MSAATLFDETAERAVLGAVLVRNEALDEIMDALEPEHFGRHHHRLTFEAMRRLHEAGRPIDPITLSGELERDGHLETVGKPWIFGLGDGIARSTNIVAYAERVRSKALLRAVRDTAKSLLAEADADGKSGAVLLEEAEQALYRLSSTTVRTDWIGAEDLAAEIYPVIEALHTDRRSVSGLATGFADVDFFTRGLQPSDLVVLGARPSQGKTAFALQVALEAAKSTTVGFFSVEMARGPLGLRGVIALSQVDGFRLMAGGMSELEHHRMADGLSRFSQARLFVDESPSLSPVQVRSKLRRLRSKAGLGLVVIDYLQLMAPLPEHRKENKTNQVAGISRALKILAREFGVPFLVLSQLNRGLERSADKRPTLSDLRDSGAVEQDADVVLLLHRPEVYDDKPELKGLAEVIIAKQRNGPTATVPLQWRGPQMRFEDRRYAS